MRFEFDAAKSTANKAKHGIDFVQAHIDREARRIGVTRQAFIKLRMSDTLVNT